MAEPSNHEKLLATWANHEQIARLATAFRDAWRRGQEPRIEAFLKEVAPGERESLFGELLRTELAFRRGRGERLLPDEYLSRFTEYCDQVTDAFAYVEATVLREQASLGDGADPGLLEALLAPNEASENNRYSTVKLHAVGGLGEIYLAQDHQLNRKVALKRLRPRSLAVASASLRFLREAELTGALEHPGVVPIYGLGHDDDGLPYYVMRFIEGATLADAINAFHRLALDSPDRKLELTKLLRRFLDVCHAIDFAHSRGVLHRDLKPANVMLGEFGETLVVDWGLAKRMEQLRPLSTADKPAEPTSSSEQRFTRTADGAEIEDTHDAELGRTEQGTIVGTPGYMSPEQARGAIDELTPASDVFGLGAVLFCILTGQSPTPRGTTAVMIRDAQFGNTKSIDELGPNIPRPLKAICRKALAALPTERYPSARRLADDVERFLADEPIEAIQETLYERVSRRLRRNRTAVIVALFFSAALTTASMIGVVAVDYQRRQTDQQREIAEQQRTATETAFVRENRQRLRAEQSTYAAQIQAADASWNSNQSAAAWLHLNASEKARRGWEYAYLRAKFQHDLPTLVEGLRPIMGLATDRTGKRVLAACRDGYVRVWEAAERRELWSQKCFEVPITAAAADAGLTHYAAVSAKGALIGTVGSPRTQPPVRGHDQPISAVEFLSASQLVTASEDGAVRICSVADGSIVRTLGPIAGTISCLAVTRDGSRIAAAGARQLIVWNAADGSRQHAVDVPDKEVLGLAFSVDGRRLAMASGDGRLKIIELTASPQVVAERKLGRAINRVMFGPADKQVISAGLDGQVRIHDGRTLVETRTLRGHTAPVAYIVSSDDGRYVFSAGSDGSVRAHRVGSPEMPRILRGHDARVVCAAFVPGTARLVSGDAEGNLRLWDTDGGTELAVMRGHSGVVNCLAATADGRRFLSAGEDGRILLWDGDGKLMAEVGREPSAVVAMAWQEDGRTVLVGRSDGIWNIWDVESRRQLQTLRSLRTAEPAALVVVAPSRMTVLQGTFDNTPLLDSLHSDRPAVALSGHQLPVLAAAVSADGSLWATGDMDSELRIWNARGQELGSLQGHTNWISALAFTPDGRRIASSSLDATIKIWDGESFQQLLSLDGHDIGVTALVFSPDGRRLASACNDGTLKVWIATP